MELRGVSMGASNLENFRSPFSNLGGPRFQGDHTGQVGAKFNNLILEFKQNPYVRRGIEECGEYVIIPHTVA